MSEFISKINQFFRPHRTIPTMPWTAENRWSLNVQRFLILSFGLTIFGFGDSLLVNSNLGNAPWTVFAQGLTLHSKLNIGLATFLISAAVLLAWIPLKVKLGFGTIMNILIIAAAIQIGVSNFPKTNNLLIGIIFCFVGVGMVGLGTAFYITCGLGPGPRDGLMTALHNRTGIRISRIRLLIEGSVFVAGVLLGGRAGLGTAIFALFVGQAIAIAIGVVSRLTA